MIARLGEFLGDLLKLIEIIVHFLCIVIYSYCSNMILVTDDSTLYLSLYTMTKNYVELNVK